MDFQTAFGEVVRDRRLANGLTLRSLSANGYLALGYLSEIERGHKCPSSQMMDAIADGLGISTYELVVETGYRMARGTIPDTTESLFPPIRNESWRKQYADLR